uniref:Uncharacterized protein n=1 Tax=viral metagenome TaxID=1070528 RepID=A0A6H1ZD79_9ZZZZ
MYIKTHKRAGWETVDMVVKNSLTYRIVAGMPLSWEIVTAQDGSVALPATSTLRCAAGIALETFGTSGQHDEVKRCRAYGWVDKIFVAGTTITAGAMLVPSNGNSYLTLAVSHATSAIEAPTEGYMWAIAGTAGCAIATSTFSTAYYVTGFVRCLG